MEEELLLASSSIDGGIGCWDLQTGAEHLRYKSCASPPHGLTCVGSRFLAASQLRDSHASSGSIVYWSWSKPQVEVKCFPEEPIKPLVANKEGTYIIGGGISGHIYIWEVKFSTVATGRLLKKWRAHYRAVTCLVFTEDDSFLVSGSEDGSVRVWSLLMMFDEYQTEQASQLYEHSFSEHTLRVTDVVTGYGGGNAIIVSASDDRTCKVWSLSKGNLLRNIVFPSIIDSLALDPGENVFYAGCRDGNIYIAALNADSSSTKSHWLHIIGSLSSHSKPVTCLAYSANGNLLLAGSEDGIIRVWDPRSHNIVRTFKHAKGPVNNIQIVKRPHYLNPRASSIVQASSRRHGSSLPPPLDKYVNSTDKSIGSTAVVRLQDTCNNPLDVSYVSYQVIANQIKELQQQGSAAAAEMEVERLKLDCAQYMQMLQKWKKMYDNLHQLCVNELLEGDNVIKNNQNII
ncbi:protein ROOT INITIATION DEFECTIVE 3 isoform X1 [Ricinus communis]|uniref:protein ROOT INITIATION DEFECTIVE 3 isoform X1 n=1 Tax=Ricinus communis TaxID=3988 RepID=UPI00201A2A2F|nr:protein ROOT INITIATION DEFECTIVE 3 isoform X1 [Ricinus communis]